MRKVAFGLLAGLVVLSSSHSVFDKAEDKLTNVLTFVAPTTFNEIGGAPLSLCLLIQQQTLFYVPVMSTSKGYVLAPNDCQSESIYFLSEASFRSAKADGTIAANVPPAPAVRTLRHHTSPMGLTVGALFIAYALSIKIRRGVRRGARLGLARLAFGNRSNVAQNTLDAMCHVAKTRGPVDGSDIAVIAAAADELTGVRFGEDKIEGMIEAASPGLEPAELHRFSRGLTNEECRTVMRGVMMVAASDGPMSPEAKIFVDDLAYAFEISDSETQGIFKKLLNPDEDLAFAT